MDKGIIARRKLLKMGIAATASILAFRHSFANDQQGIIIDHAFGNTYLPQPAKRIVTIGMGSEDAALALGVVPLGLIAYPGFEGNIFPWNKPLFKGQTPVFIDYILNYEQIALLKPDAILAILSGMREQDYWQLSKIAPVIPYLSKPWMTNWQDVLKTTALVLGKENEGKILTQHVESQLTSYFNKYPILQNKKFLYGSYSAGSNNLTIYTLNDPRAVLLAQHGMQPADIVKEISVKNPDKWYYDMSLELAENIDADVLLLWFMSPDGENNAKQNPLMHYIKAFQTGAYVAIEKPDEVWALSFPSVVSIPYFYPKLVKDLAQALEVKNDKHDI